DVLQGGHPAGGDDGRVGVGAHPTEELEVRTGEHPIAGDVGDHEPGAAGGVEALQRRHQVTTLPGPTAGGELVTADVQADGDPVAVLGDDALHPVGVLQGGGADHHAAAAGGQRAVQARLIADPAGQFDVDPTGLDHPGQHAGVGSPPEGGVQVDQVQP